MTPRLRNLDLNDLYFTKCMFSKMLKFFFSSVLLLMVISKMPSFETQWLSHAFCHMLHDKSLASPQLLIPQILINLHDCKLITQICLNITFLSLLSRTRLFLLKFTISSGPKCQIKEQNNWNVVQNKVERHGGPSSYQSTKGSNFPQVLFNFTILLFVPIRKKRFEVGFFWL